MHERINSSYDCVFVTKYAIKAKKIKFKVLSNWFTMSA